MVTEQIRHIPDHRAGQTAPDAHDIQQLMIVDLMPLLHKVRLYLRHDAPPSAEGKPADPKKYR